MKKTNRQIIEFMNVAQQWLEPQPQTEENRTKTQERAKTKFAYALRKVLRKCNRAYETYQEDIQDVNVENCSVDEKGNIIQEMNGQYHYTREAMQKRLKEIRKLQDKVADIEPHFVTAADDLTDTEVEVFTEFVIKPQLEVVA